MPDKSSIQSEKKNAEQFSPQSASFLMTFCGIIGVILIAVSVYFGIYSIFAPPDPLSPEDEIAKEFHGLNATLAAKNSEINAELTAMIHDGLSLNQLMHKNVPAENDLRQALFDSFHEIDWEKKLPSLRRDVTRNSWQIGQLGLESHLPLLKNYDARRQLIRQLLEKPNVDMQPTYSLDIHGFYLKKEDCDLLWGYVHLEEYEIGRALRGLTLDQIASASKNKTPTTKAETANNKSESANNKTETANNKSETTNKPDMNAALNAWNFILKAAEIASRQKEINLRLAAVFIRENAMETLQTLVRDPNFTREHQQKAFQILDRHLQRWSSDSLLFEGERASGIWFYEIVRYGGLYEIATKEDIAALEKIGSLLDLEPTIRKQADADELFYLRQMEKLIQLNRRPLDERFALLGQWEDEMETLRGDTKTYPIVAGTILLRDVHKIISWLAEDKARVQAWTFALAKATDRPTENFASHPSTGAPFLIQNTDDLSGNKLISVTWDDNISPIEVPVRK